MRFQYTGRFGLRYARDTDARFILDLRLNPGKARFLSKVEDDLEAQRDWLRGYQQREVKGEEYYFIVEEAETGEPAGVVRVYDIDLQKGSFEWGSWIMKEGAPPTAAIESALSVYEFAFGHLGLRHCHFKVFKENERVVQFHRRFGAESTGEDDENFYFELTLKNYSSCKQRFRKFLLKS